MNPSHLFYLVQAGYALTLLACAFKSTVRLRLALCASSLLFIAYGFMAAAQPLWFPIVWNALFIAAHSYYLFFRFGSGETTLVNPTAIFLSKTALSNFPAGEVNSFLALANEGELPKGHAMIQVDTELQYLFCILQGGVEVRKGGKKITELKAGCFVGEMSLLTKSRTRADVYTLENSRFLAWKHSDINDWLAKNPVRLSYLQSALGAQVVEELLRQNQEMQEAAGEAA
jgi:hypothetical protein